MHGLSSCTSTFFHSPTYRPTSSLKYPRNPPPHSSTPFSYTISIKYQTATQLVLYPSITSPSQSSLTCHFCSPLSLCAAVDAVLLLAIFGSCSLTYSCAKLAQTFLCVLKCAFWQSLLQYDTLWHLRHCFSDSGDLEHCAHVGVDGVEDEDEEASGCVVSVLSLDGADADADDWDAMVAEYE
jgi:hypothetical protein